MSLIQKLMFVPFLAHIFLVFFLFIRLGIEKSAAVKTGQADRKKAALDNSAWPENVVKVSNNIANQFQVPMLFYALTFSLLLTNAVNLTVLIAMMLFVVSRYIHTYIHITSNYVPHRFKAFTFGTVLLLGVAVWQAISLISSI